MSFAGDFPLNSTAQERGASVRDSTPMRWPGAPAFRAWRARALPVKLGSGGVGEWLNPAVLKTVRPERVSGVRIPPPPPSIFEYHEVIRPRCQPHWTRVLNKSNILLTIKSTAPCKTLAETVVQSPILPCDAPVTKHQGTVLRDISSRSKSVG